MHSGTTESGFHFEIEDNALNNMELLDVLEETEDNPIGVSKACTLLLGKDQKKALYDHVRREDGTVPIDKVCLELKSIFAALGKTGKN